MKYVVSLLLGLVVGFGAGYFGHCPYLCKLAGCVCHVSCNCDKGCCDCANGCCKKCDNGCCPTKKCDGCPVK